MMTERKATGDDVEAILRDVYGVLNYHHCSGIENYPGGEEIHALLRLRIGSGSPQDAVRQQLPAAAGDRERTIRQVAAPQVKRAPEQVPVTPLGDIQEEVRGCTGCTLSSSRIVPVAGGGGEKARLLIVGDWLAVQKGQAASAGCVFGIEQDRMLGRMLEAIKLPRKEVFVTNVIKCGIPVDCQPKAEHMHACLSFLHRQIVSLQPAVILSMGLIATRALLNRKEPLSKLRGQLHVCNDSNGRQIPLIATYHPTFLLQNPEMKKATWLDLQLLARQLGLAVG